MALPHWRLLVAGIVVCFVGASPLGFNDAVLNIPIDIIKQFLNTSYSDELGKPATSTQIDLLWSLVIGAYGVGLICGSFSVAAVADKFGRKWSLLLIGGILLLSGHLLMASSKFVDRMELLMVGRFIVGFEGCAALGFVTLWLIESSPMEHAGFMGSMSNSFVAIGMLFAQFLALPQVLGNSTMWPFLLGAGAVNALLGFVASVFLPESPKYLAIVKENYEKASSAILFYHGPRSDPDDVIDEFENEQAMNPDTDHYVTFKWSRLWKRQHYRNPLLITLIANSLPSALGWFSIGVYSTTIFKDNGLPTNTANALTTAIMGVSAAGAIVSPTVIGYLKRRHLLFSTAIVITIGNLLVFVLLLLYQHYKSIYLSYGIAVVFILEALVYNFGPGPIPLILAVELCPQEIRAISTTMGVFVLHTGVFLSQTFIDMTYRSIGPYTFLLFGLLAVPMIIFLYEKLPESKDKPIFDIISVWLPQDVDEDLPLLF